ncbi:MAG: hypothetical protein DRH34_03965 [Deltaproteobacteria bacterium]|nr:MAG: hypothetical protein DRH34_03965 [Deltaproteobacteria bacterium]RLC20196.1 MAG: hypothetical protein DRH93_14140 [Deltaproteobacteria bacterium]
MKIKKLLTVSVLFMLIISGCVSIDPLLNKFESKETKLVRQYIAEGEALEKEDLFSNALEQYKLALTVDPESEEAVQHKKNVLSKLWQRAQLHYKKGIKLDEQGKYEAARKEYLSALQNWPDHKGAKDKLTPGEVEEEKKDYIIHTLKYGESVSQLAMIYYGDFKKHTIIGKFNVLKDVTKVRVGEKIKIPVIENIPLQKLKQRQKNYFDSQKTVSPVAVPEKPEKKIEPIVEEVKVEVETIQPPVVEETEPKQELIEENMQKEAVQMPEPSFEENKKEISENYEQGIDLFNKKKYPEAITSFMAAAELDPKNESLLDYLFNSHFQQGLALFNSKEYLSAKDHFESALKYDENCEKCPDYIEKCEETYKEKHYNLGIHYFGKEQLSKAIEEWNLVKEIDPDYKEVTPNLKKAEMLYKRLESIKQGKSE